MGVRDTARCSRCRKDFPFTQVRTLPDGKRLACHACLGTAQKEEAQQRERAERMHDFQCVACRYAFRRAEQSPPRICPQCGASKLLKFDREKITADTMLKL